MTTSTSKIVQLCVGGTMYSTNRDTLMFVPNSKIANWFETKSASKLEIDSQGRYQIDRDGCLFRYILNYLRNRGTISLPENFSEYDSLRMEAEFYGLDGLAKSLRTIQSSQNGRMLSTRTNAQLSLLPTHGTEQQHQQQHQLQQQQQQSVSPSSPSPNHFGGYGVARGTGGPGFITVGYRGSFAFGRDGLADVKFRKLTKILVMGKVAICREVFGDTLNESRDPDHGDDENRYTARFFLKHLCLEQAFDCLQESGFRCVGSCGSGTASIPATEPVKPGIDSEETRWNHYNEFLFSRP